jgi:hypothetical protein
VWENIILKKTSSFKTLYSWWVRWNKPTEEKTEAFNDIWLTREEIEKDFSYALRNIKSEVDGMLRGLRNTYYNDITQEDDKSNITYMERFTFMPQLNRNNLKTVFMLYDSLTDERYGNYYTMRDYLDNRSSIIWNYSVDQFKRSNRNSSYQTEGTKRRRLKRMFPDKVAELFSEQERKKIEKFLLESFSGRKYRVQRAIKDIIQNIDDEEEVEYEIDVIRSLIREATGGY